MLLSTKIDLFLGLFITISIGCCGPTPGVFKHYGITAHRNIGNVFYLNLEEYDPSAIYWMLADIKGTRPQDQLPGRAGSRGIVYLRREKDLDWQSSLMNVQPYKSVDAADAIKEK